MIAPVGDGAECKNGRHLAAWMGLVPWQHSSGNRQILMGISKRGDQHLRTLLVHGARSVVRVAAGKTDALIPTALSTDLRPFSGGDGSDCFWVVGEEVPGFAAGVDDVVVAVEDGDGEFVGAQVSPDVLDGVQFRSVGRQVQEGYVVRDGESYRSVPASAVEDEERMG